MLVCVLVRMYDCGSMEPLAAAFAYPMKNNFVRVMWACSVVELWPFWDGLSSLLWFAVQRKYELHVSRGWR